MDIKKRLYKRKIVGKNTKSKPEEFTSLKYNSNYVFLYVYEFLVYIRYCSLTWYELTVYNTVKNCTTNVTYMLA